MTPVAKISFSFQLSGSGDGFTRSFEIVMMVPKNTIHIWDNAELDIFTYHSIDRHIWQGPTIIKDGDDKNHERWEVEFPYQRNKQKSKLQELKRQKDQIR